MLASRAFNSIFRKSQYKGLFITMLVFSVVGLIASFVLAIDEFRLMNDPNVVLECSFNLVLNCSAVMQTWQASVFGFPNMFIGLMAYPVMITVAIVGLTRVKFSRWFKLAMFVCVTLGALFSYWLFFNSLYDIRILCPWCLVVTFSTTIIWETVIRYSLRENVFGFVGKADKKIQKYLDKDFDKFITGCWIVLLVLLVYLKFGSELFA